MESGRRVRARSLCRVRAARDRRGRDRRSAAILAERRRAVAALAAALAALVLGGALRGHDLAVISFAATDTIADQSMRLVRAAAVMSGWDHRYDAALQRPEPTGDLAALAGRDVFLVFVESYGTAVLDEPRYREAVAPALEDFAAAARRAGYGIRSSRLVSPVFGGGFGARARHALERAQARPLSRPAAPGLVSGRDVALDRADPRPVARSGAARALRAAGLHRGRAAAARQQG